MQLESPAVATLSLIPSGAAGINETLRVMRALTREGKKNLRVRETAGAQTKSCQQKDYSCEVRTLHAFVRDSIRYLGDINGVETVQAPQKTLEYGYGDCDDKSVLLASLLESIGHPTRFVAIGFAPGVFEHVYVETLIGTRWIALETTEPVEAGWSPDPKAVRARMEMYN